MAASMIALSPFRCSAFRYGKILALASGLCGLLASGAYAQLVPSATNLPALRNGSAEYGDYDGDDDLDLVLCGRDSTNTLSTRIYRNDLTSFTVQPDTIPGIEYSDLYWADFDSDGDPDLFMAGANSTGTPIAQIRWNTAGSFHSSTSLTGVTHASTDGADVDGDGDVDLVVSGLDAGGQPSTLHYTNVGGVFFGVGAGLLPVSHGSLGFADADEDGDPDMLLTGRDGGGIPRTMLYRNDAGTFVSVVSTLPDVDESAVAWADFDNDGRMDLVLSGMGLVPFTSAYRNDGFPVFGNRDLFGAALHSPSVSWGDYDADGDSDIALCGTDAGGLPQTLLYRHDGGGVFVQVSTGLDSLHQGAVRWADTDNDDRLELLIIGSDGSAPEVAFFDNVGSQNNRPAVVSNLMATILGANVTFSWDSGSDPQTGTFGLSYDLRIGSAPGSHNVVPAHTNVSTGHRRVVREGNMGHRTSWTMPVSSLPASVYWSVQAVDASYAGSAFAVERLLHTSSSTTLGVVPSPSNAGQSVTMTATVTPATATGTVRFKDGATTLANRPLIGGTANHSTSSLAAGVHSLTAEYLGDSESPPSTSAVFEHTVKTSTTTSITSSPQPSLPGEEVTITATVSPATAGGLLSFTDFGLPIGSGTVSGGVATLLTSALSPGSHQLRAVYAGDGLHLESISNIRSHTVWIASSVSLSTNPNPSDEGEEALITAVVSPPSATGGITFKDGTMTLGTAPLSGGIATLPRIFNTAGVRSLTAEYSGSPAYAPSTSPVYPHVVTGATVVSVNSTPNPSVPGQAVSISATLDRPAATGTVIFRDGVMELGTATVSGGAATLPPITTLAIGSHALIAEYSGDGVHLAGYSDTLGHRVIAFQEIGAGLPGVLESAVAWGDYDSDGDLDILLTGDAGTEKFSRVYRNDSGAFVDIGAGLSAVYFSSVAWGDYDNDGDLDILLAGTSGGGAMSHVYRNDGGVFVDIGGGLPGVKQSAVAWGDYDNDGDLDILLTGDAFVFEPISRVYRNDDGAFVDIDADLTGVRASSAAWGDYDNDGDLDILLTGRTVVDERVSRVYRNDDGVFVDIGAGLPGVAYSSVAWGDHDSDGDLDILLTGLTVPTGRITRVYRNDGGVFVDIDAGLPGVGDSSVAWGDCDNDGDLDILLTGQPAADEEISRVYRNDEGVFIDIDAGLPGAYSSAVAWGDYDNDGDLDILLTGRTAVNERISHVYRNLSPIANTIPNAPSGLQADVIDGRIVFHWDAAADAETPSSGLSYNLRVGTTPGGNEISSAMASGNGYRRVPRFGNAIGDTTWTLDLPVPAPSTIYWSVQAIDAAFAGSPFSPEQQMSGFDWTIITGSGLPGWLYNGGATWGDYDGDGDLDILAAGDIGATPMTFVFNNDGSGIFSVDPNAVLTPLMRGGGSWVDYDGDGDLDILISGEAAGQTDIIRLYRNDLVLGTHVFTEVATNLPSIRASGMAWGDYDNDGDPDLFLSGQYGYSPNPILPLTKLFQNVGGGVFTDSGIPFPFILGNGDWGDHDRDGDLDLVVAGSDGSGTLRTKLYRNDDGTLIDSGVVLTALSGASVEWGDYDLDGWPDLLLAGTSSSTGAVTQLYRNDQMGGLTLVPAGLSGLYAGGARWGDYDNDGDLDIVQSGRVGVGQTRIYRNDHPGGFVDTQVDLPGVFSGATAWGDYDDDGDLDFLLSGLYGSGGAFCGVIRNNRNTVNTLPLAPSNPSHAFADGKLVLSWDAASDFETPAEALTYNIRVGTTPGGGEIAPGLADPISGRRLVVRRGNADQRLAWSIRLDAWPSPPQIYWAVQAIDTGFEGSPWAGAEVSGVEDDLAAAPKVLALNAAPNPFATSTRIAFDLPTSGRVTIAVHDVQGRRVRSLAAGAWPSGRHVLDWDGRTDLGRTVAPGVYFVRLESGRLTESRRVVLAR